MATPAPTTQDGIPSLPDQHAQGLTIVAVMGTTGSGKSTFVQRATGSQEVVVGHRLQACTQEPCLYEFMFEGRPIALLDTPGFDDTYKTDAEVLQGVATFLAGTYKRNFKLSGIIYLQRITDPRMTHGGRANLELFRALCGDDPLRKVVLATTFWGAMNNKQRAEEHEEELRTNPDYWGDMLSKKAKMAQFHDTTESALEIISGLLEKEEKITLKIQREMVDQNLDLVETTAGETLSRELSELTARYEKQVAQLKTDMEAALKTRDLELQEVKEMQMKKAERAGRAFQNQMDLLKARTREDMRARDMEYDAKMSRMTKEYEVSTLDHRERRNALNREEKAHRIQIGRRKSSETQTPSSSPSPSQALGSPVEGAEPSSNGSKADIQPSASPSGTAVASAKYQKREKMFRILGAVGTTVTAAGVSVINPLAIPVAIGGLIGLLNACFCKNERETGLDRKPEVYQDITSN